VTLRGSVGVTAAAPEPDARIEVHVGELKQFFNSMDPAPFRERDLDPRAEEFIVESARELPREAPLALVVQLGREAPTAEGAAVLGAWVALWRPMEIFLYDWWPIRGEIKLYDRLAAMTVRVVGAPAASTAPASST
jgi:hypothetical protein